MCTCTCSTLALVTTIRLTHIVYPMYYSRPLLIQGYPWKGRMFLKPGHYICVWSQLHREVYKNRQKGVKCLGLVTDLWVDFWFSERNGRSRSTSLLQLTLLLLILVKNLKELLVDVRMMLKPILHVYRSVRGGKWGSCGGIHMYTLGRGWIHKGAIKYLIFTFILLT